MNSRNISITQANLSDTPSIMDFMDRVWRKDHILSRNKQLFLHEFQNNDKLNIIIAKDCDEQIVGIFGFIYYNSSETPDLAGSLWKVDESIREPLLGFKLRNYFKKKIKHNFFAAPGANIETKAIYQVLKMRWNIMAHYYIANENIQKFHIAKNPLIKKIKIKNTPSKIQKINSPKELQSFDFDQNKDLLPKKDLNYIKHKFFNHPLRKYDIYALSVEGNIENIFVCRVAQHLQYSVYRVVDFYGQTQYFDDITQFLYRYILIHNYEYVDFLTYGLDEKLFLRSQWNKIEFEDQNTIIPNLFEPFIQKNSPIYCVSDTTNFEFRQFKADGDQDRPNVESFIQK